MATLKIGLLTFEAGAGRVAQEAERMFRLSPKQRARRVSNAKTTLVRAADIETPRPAMVKQAAAIILSQGIREI